MLTEFFNNSANAEGGALFFSGRCHNFLSNLFSSNKNTGTGFGISSCCIKTGSSKEKCDTIIGASSQTSHYNCLFSGTGALSGKLVNYSNNWYSLNGASSFMHYSSGRNFSHVNVVNNSCQHVTTFDYHISTPSEFSFTNWVQNKESIGSWGIISLEGDGSILTVKNCFLVNNNATSLFSRNLGSFMVENCYIGLNSAQVISGNVTLGNTINGPFSTFPVIMCPSKLHTLGWFFM